MHIVCGGFCSIHCSINVLFPQQCAQEFDIAVREERLEHLLVLLTDSNPEDQGGTAYSGATVRHLTSDQLLRLGSMCQTLQRHGTADLTPAAQRCFTLAIHALLSESAPRYSLIAQVRVQGNAVKDYICVNLQTSWSRAVHSQYSHLPLLDLSNSNRCIA